MWRSYKVARQRIYCKQKRHGSAIPPLIKVNDKVKVCFATAFDIKKEDEDFVMAATLNGEKPVIIRKPIPIDDLVKRVKMELGDSQPR